MKKATADEILPRLCANDVKDFFTERDSSLIEVKATDASHGRRET